MLNVEELKYLEGIRTNPDERNAFLTRCIARDQFSRTEDTQWAYFKVLSYLEDEWKAVRTYSPLREELRDVGFDLDLVGRIANRIVGGTREHTVGQGDFPTPHDMGAYVFYSAFEAPRVFA